MPDPWLIAGDLECELEALHLKYCCRRVWGWVPMIDQPPPSIYSFSVTASAASASRIITFIAPD